MVAFTLLTLNTHQGFSALNRRFILAELREAVHQVSADVVCLQEVLGAHEPLSRRHGPWPATPHYEFIADTLWPQFAYGRNAVYPHGHHGNAVLSKFPIARYLNHDVSVPGTEQRGMLWCVLEVPGQHRQIHVVCVHLGLRESHRQRQLRALCRLIDEEIPADAPLLVAGDFNDWRQRADLVLEQDEGLDQHLGGRGFDGVEHGREERLAVLQQGHLVAVGPGRLHALTSTSSGAWSDRCDHGRPDRMRHRPTSTLRA